MKPSAWEIMRLCVESYLFGIHVCGSPSFWRREIREIERRIYAVKCDLFWKARMRSLYSFGSTDYTSTVATFLLPPASGEYYSKIYRLTEHPTQAALPAEEQAIINPKIARLEFSSLGPIVTCRDVERIDKDLLIRIISTLNAHDLCYIPYAEMQNKIESGFSSEHDYGKTWYDVAFRSE